MRLSLIGTWALVGAVLLSGCATLTRGETQRVRIRTDPPGATVLILPDGDEIKTPGHAELRRDRAVTLLIHKDGYLSTRAYLDREADPWATLAFAGNLLLGGLIGMHVDMNSGALLHLVPNSVKVVLKPETGVQGRSISESSGARLTGPCAPLMGCSDDAEVDPNARFLTSSRIPPR